MGRVSLKEQYIVIPLLSHSYVYITLFSQSSTLVTRAESDKK